MVAVGQGCFPIYIGRAGQAGLSLNPRLILPGDFSMAGGERSVNSLPFLAADDRPTAIFAANDETALGVMSGLRRLGWHVPKDVSVCGFGDLPVAQAGGPTLTTVHIGLRELGRTGALKVLALLKNEAVETTEIAPTYVIERDSTAPI